MEDELHRMMGFVLCKKRGEKGSCDIAVCEKCGHFMWRRMEKDVESEGEDEEKKSDSASEVHKISFQSPLPE